MQSSNQLAMTIQSSEGQSEGLRTYIASRDSQNPNNHDTPLNCLGNLKMYRWRTETTTPVIASLHILFSI